MDDRNQCIFVQHENVLKISTCKTYLVLKYLGISIIYRHFGHVLVDAFCYKAERENRERLIFQSVSLFSKLLPGC